MKENVLLVYAPMDDYYFTEGVNDSPPLGLVALQNYVVRTLGLNVNVDIVDGEYNSLDEIINIIVNSNYQLVGVQSMMASYNNSLHILKKAKECGAATVMGGHHATQLADRIIRKRNSFVDYIVVGDGEYAFAALIKEEPLEKIPNLVYFDSKANEVVHTISENVPIDIGKIDYIDGKILKQYAKVNSKRLEREQALSSFRSYSHKGCSNRLNTQYCYFCGRADRGVRFKSPEVFVDELIFLSQLPNVKYIFEIGDDFLQSEEWLLKVCDLKNKKLPESGVHLKIFARANRITSTIIEYLKRLEVDEVAIGFESGSEKILRNINKNATPDDNLNAAKLLFANGIDTIASFVLGLPGEDDDSLLCTYEQAQRVNELAYKYLGRPPQEIIGNLIEINPGSIAFKKIEQVFPEKYSRCDNFDVVATQDDYFKAVFHLKDDQQIASFRRKIAKWGKAINQLGKYTYPAGWRKGDLDENL